MNTQTMNTLTAQLADQLVSLNNDMRSFVEQCDDQQWQTMMPDEQWPVNVAMHHILTGHYAIIGLIKRKMRDQPLPQLSNEFIDSTNASNAEGAAGITQSDVLALIEKYAVSSAEFLRTLNDDQIKDTIYFGPAGGDIEMARLIDLSIVQSARQHLDRAIAASNL